MSSEITLNSIREIIGFFVLTWKGDIFMYELLIGLSIIAVVTFTILSFIDREFRFLEESGIRKVKFIKISKTRILFFSWMKKDETISLFLFVMILTFYLVNVLGIVFLTLHLITQLHVLLVLCNVLLFLNSPILIISLMKISLSKEEQKRKEILQKK